MTAKGVVKRMVIIIGRDYGEWVLYGMWTIEMHLPGTIKLLNEPLQQFK